MNVKYIRCTDSEFKKVKEIRTAVFTNEQGADKNEFDSYDSDERTLYCLIEDNGEAVATGRLAFIDKGIKLGRIAVLKSERGKGTGRLLVESLCVKADELDNDVFVDAQLHAVPFYEKLGFTATGEKEITDRGILHLPMRKV